MKKIVFFLTTVLFLNTANSQITLEQSFTGQEIYQSSFITIDNEVKYYYYDIGVWTLYIYNSNNSIYKTIIVDTDPISGFLSSFYPFIESVFIFSVSQTVFDTDSGIEFLIQLTDNEYKTIIVDDDGTILFNVDNQSPSNDEAWNGFQYPNFISNTSNGLKMILRDSDYGGINIYSLPGTIPSLSNRDEVSGRYTIGLNSYPNPAREYTNIVYEIPNGEKLATIVIYNTIGQTVKEFKVDSRFDKIRLSTDDLKSGTYFYNLRTENYVSKGKKMIVIN